MGFRKVIVNGGSKCASMEAFAMRRIAEGSYAITVNMSGVVVYRAGHEKKKYSSKGTRFGQLLFKIYKELGLHNKPLFIIGRRKVDRGLGFHFTPRDGSEGLVWTDMILGRVDDKSTAVQKAGRLAGVVVHCPQYSGSLTWWTDEKTASMICRHNDVVDVANSKKGCSALQALVRGEAEVPIEEIVHHDSISHLEEFDEMKDLITRWKTIVTQGQQKIRSPAKPRQVEGVYLCSVGGKSERQMASTIRTKFSGPSTSNWGSGLTTSKPGEYIHRVYVGYEEGGNVKFFLRWTQKV
jgi:hypothetical protein